MHSGWYTPIVPATRETKAGESLEPRHSKPLWKTQQNPVSKRSF